MPRSAKKKMLIEVTFGDCRPTKTSASATSSATLSTLMTIERLALRRLMHSFIFHLNRLAQQSDSTVMIKSFGTAVVLICSCSGQKTNTQRGTVKCINQLMQLQTKCQSLQVLKGTWYSVGRLLYTHGNSFYNIVAQLTNQNLLHQTCLGKQFLVVSVTAYLNPITGLVTSTKVKQRVSATFTFFLLLHLKKS